MSRPRRHQGYWAFLAHRLSGLLLALFLPAHFLVLGLALEGADSLESFIGLTRQPLVKFGEWGLVVLLAVHLGLGIRVLALEFLPWRDQRAAWVGWSAGAAVVAGGLFVASLLL